MKKFFANLHLSATTEKLSFLVIVLLLIVTAVTVSNSQKKQETQTQAAGGSSSGAGPSLLFGTNLLLMDSSDQFLTSSQTRAALQQMHVTTIRMPIRSVGAPSQDEIQAAQYIKSINAVPLVILKYSQPDPGGAGVQVVQAMNSIFGTSPVYYEFGNERDLAGVNQTAYTTAWNQYIPQIKAAATNGRFGGPTNYQTNPSYIAYFVQNANPAPDFISWHEYTCGNSDSGATCIANISHWSTHIANTKAAIQATGKPVPPIFITEWNYDPNNPSGDSRATPQFEQQFVTTALQELEKDGVTAAYQYVVTGHTEYNLVDPSGQLTAAGQAFEQATGATAVTFPLSPTLVPSSFGCLGSCPTLPATPTLSGGTNPSSSLSTFPSVTQNISPAPTSSAPCTTTTSQSVTAAKSDHDKDNDHDNDDKKKHTRHKGTQNRNGLLADLLHLLQQLLKLIEQLLGGNQPSQPTPTPCPSPLPTTPVSPLPSGTLPSASPAVSGVPTISLTPSVSLLPTPSTTPSALPTVSLLPTATTLPSPLPSHQLSATPLPSVTQPVTPSPTLFGTPLPSISFVPSSGVSQLPTATPPSQNQLKSLIRVILQLLEQILKLFQNLFRRH